MRVFQFTPGTGHYYCGSCLRDDTLSRALRRRGHEVLVVPLYLPLVLEDAESDAAVHMGGINMYVQQKVAASRFFPGWFERLLDSPGLLRWVSRRGGMTEPADLGALTVSMLRGEAGHQKKEVEKLVEWTRHEAPADVLCLSNVMLVGMARRLKETLGSPVVCTLQGEAPFLDTLTEPYRSQAWAVLAERARDVDRFVAVSRYYADLMIERLQLASDRVHVVHNGIDADDVELAVTNGAVPTIGYLARMNRDKGIDTLVDAFVRVHERGKVAPELRVAGVMLDEDRPFVHALRRRLEEAGLETRARFHANVSRAEKLAFLRELTVLSVPATYGESFGLYLLEAWAAGVPVVQPRHGAFPELLARGGGLLCAPHDADALAAGLEELLVDREAAARLAADGRRAVAEYFTSARMASEFEAVCKMAAS